MRIIIHGGMHKTGTTALQHLIVTQRALMERLGIYVPPGRPSTMARALNVRRPDWSKEELLEQLQDAEDAQCQTLLLSSEIVSIFSAEWMQKLVDAASGHELRFVFSFRHWYEFLPSRWVEYSKRRDSQTYLEFLAYVSDPAFEFEVVLHRALSTGAEVSAISYANANDGGSSTVAEVLLSVGMARKNADTLARRAKKVNRRANWIDGELLRLLNGAEAARLGLPGNDLAAAQMQMRKVDCAFTLFKRFENVDPSVMDRLRNAVARHETIFRTSDHIDIAGPLDRLQAYAGLFTNLVDGRIFATIPDDRVTVADIDWSTFQAQNRDLVERALDAMLEQRP